MQRYFLEVAYKGSGFAGFQIQENAKTVQSEVQRALKVLFKQEILLTGSSRTDAGVHALQNFFHFDSDLSIAEKQLYNLNALLPPEIVIRHILPVRANAHCRFDAVSRQYGYHIYQHKNPFLNDRAFYFPFPLDFNRLQEAAAALAAYTDFTSFSKRNTQVKNFNCRIMTSSWVLEENQFIYRVKSNRFLRGMVRGLTGTMLMVGQGKITISDFQTIIKGRDCTLVNFAVPGHGLFLESVQYPDGYFNGM